MAAQYIKSSVDTIPTQKFQRLAGIDPEFKALPTTAVYDDLLHYFLEFYVDNYITLAIGRIKEKLRHLSNLVM